MMKNTITNDSDLKNRIADANIIETAINNELAMSELKKIYWHEKQLLVAIRIMLSSATTFELVESLTALRKYTKAHIEKLETNFPSIFKSELKK